MSESDELTLKIMRHLEIDWQYIAHAEPRDTERIALVRSAGRKAGRQLGWKIATMQTNPARREDGRVVVAVTVRETPNAEDDARMSERSRLLIDQALNLFNLPLRSVGGRGPTRCVSAARFRLKRFTEGDRLS
ncbi:hypothetical protein AAH979_13135 [Plantactinospora sp. ZYX-F-223]|uniref:hypothetical protein n=1 Tax=Plantactinospora sp. ZYX-F-223 TaxID=3144103 RepID=UPI0031FD2513